MTIKDRGNIKWNSLMLVKHKKMLEKLKEKEKNRKKPELEEQELQRLNRIIFEAIEKKRQVKITYYREKKYYKLKGLVEKYIAHQDKIVINSLKSREKIHLSTGDIVNVQFV